jgi:hypothetical protein
MGHMDQIPTTSDSILCNVAPGLVGEKFAFSTF